MITDSARKQKTNKTTQKPNIALANGEWNVNRDYWINTPELLSDADRDQT
jgi:hypothetical protein